MAEVKRTNNDLKKHTHKTKDRVTRTPLITHRYLVYVDNDY